MVAPAIVPVTENCRFLALSCCRDWLCVGTGAAGVRRGQKIDLSARR